MTKDFSFWVALSETPFFQGIIPYLVGILLMAILLLMRLRRKNIFKKAHYYFEKGEKEKAVKFLELILKIEPHNVLALEKLISIYLEQNLLDKVIQCYERLIKLTPFDVKRALELGELLEKKGAYPQAETTYQQLLKTKKLEPKDALQVHRLLHRLYSKEGRWVEASQELEAIRSLSPEDSVVLLELATMYTREKKYLNALQEYIKVGDKTKKLFSQIKEALEKLIQAEEKNVELLEEIRRVYETLGLFEEVEKLYQKILDLSPTPEYFKSFLTFLINRGEFKKTGALLKEIQTKCPEAKNILIEAIQKILEFEEDTLSLRKFLSELYLESGQIEEGLAEIEKIKSFRDEIEESSLQGLKFVLSREGPEAAFKEVTSFPLPRLTSEIGKALLYQIGETFESKNKFNEAKECYQKLSEIDIEYKDVSEKLTFLQKKLQPEIKEKEKEEVKEEELEEKKRIELNNQVVKLVKEGALDEAEALAKKLIEMAPSFPTAHSNLGYIYMKKKLYQEAEGEFSKALSLAPEKERGYYSLAMALLYQKKFSEAEALKAKLEEKNPESVFIEKIQTALETFKNKRS
jgi:tetratricopeptide (TPR) repeat protein